MTKSIQCECGQALGEPCQWTGDVAETVLVEYMPEALRASHEAAGNRGEYPHNGALRLSCERGCADRLTHVWEDGQQTSALDPWVSVVAGF
jgi:hypothetical protein